MPDLLLELLTEEIPARMQGIAAEELKRLAELAFDEAHLAVTSIASHVTPRRLVLAAAGLPLAQPGSAEERRGPRVGAPEAAVQGFLKSAGLAALDQCEKRATDKGEFYFAVIRRHGRPTAEILPGILRGIIETLPWPKSMRFPAARFRWVRPMVSVISIFNGEVLPLDLDDIPVGKETLGHRFLWNLPFAVDDFDDYRAKLRTAHVMLDADERKKTITEGLAKEASAAGLTVKEDAALLDEVTGLAEWPVVLMGRIEPEFMALPPEVLTTSMRTHQKYFACLDGKGALAPRFLLVANTIADDGGKAIIAGNERVLRARLSDAKFFWDQDRKVKLEARVAKLAERVFHAKLGSVLEKVERVEKLAEALAPYVKADADSLRRAARLAKADLSTGMVGEFPELQGVMGRYYALHDGEAPAIAEAIAEHYAPQGPSDRCPSAPVSVGVALADKIDTLVGFFLIDEKPTGSKDPYALRRAALGMIRLILENKLRLPLVDVLSDALATTNELLTRNRLQAASRSGQFTSVATMTVSRQSRYRSEPVPVVVLDLLDFFADRLKVALRDQGVRHDLIAAVFALGEDDLVRLRKRVDALGVFLATEDGANLLVAYRRAANIVRIEEKNDGVSYNELPDRAVFKQAEEFALDLRLKHATSQSQQALKNEDFAGAMTALAALRAPVDEFFNKVTVNLPGKAEGDRVLRANRLRLLSQIRDTLNRVADFSQIEG
jgi:glycyl-tRNA synthetase beta chain